MILQVDKPLTIYEKPATRFVADFIGETNFLNGEIEAIEPGRVRVTIAGQPVFAQAADAGLTRGQKVTLTIRPEKLALSRSAAAPNGSALTGAVREVVYIGTDTRYVVGLPSGEAVVARVQNLGGHGLGEFQLGEPVTVSWDSADARTLTA